MYRVNELYRIIDFEKETETKRLGLTLLENKIEDLNESWRDKLEALDALTFLAANGVTKEHVLEVRNFLANQNKINMTTFFADLKRYGSTKQVLSQLDNDIMKRTLQRLALKMELSSLLEDRKNLENETGSMYIVEDSPKAKAHRLIPKSSSLQAEVDLPNKEKEKGRAENSPHGVNNTNTIMTANTKPQSEQP
jgi:hypothetical protein